MTDLDRHSLKPGDLDRHCPLHCNALTQAAGTLKRLQKATGKTQAELVEEALKLLQRTPRKAKGK